MLHYYTYEVSIAQQQFRYQAKKQIYNDYPTMLQSQLRNHFLDSTHLDVTKAMLCLMSKCIFSCTQLKFINETALVPIALALCS